MTDQELKDLVASLALAQQKTDARFIKDEDRLTKIEAIVADLALSQKKTDVQLAKTDAQQAKTEATVEKLAKMYGGAANNQGAVAEEFYFNSLKDHRVLQGIHFDSIDKNITRERGGIQDEFDILLLNDQNVFIIEVKYKAHPNDLKRLVQKKATNFKKLFPAYNNHRHHLGLASFYLDDETIESALDQGVTLLQRKGDLIETTPTAPFH